MPHLGDKKFQSKKNISMQLYLIVFQSACKTIIHICEKGGALAVASQVKLCLNHLGFSHVSLAQMQAQMRSNKVLDMFEKPVKRLPSPSPSSEIMVGKRDPEKLRQWDNLNWFESGSEGRITDTEIIDTINKLYCSHAIHIY